MSSIIRPPRDRVCGLLANVSLLQSILHASMWTVRSHPLKTPFMCIKYDFLLCVEFNLSVLRQRYEEKVMSVQYLADKEHDVSRGRSDEPSSILWLEPDLIVAGTLDGHLRAWNGRTGRSFDAPPWKAHTLGVHSLSYASTSQTLLTAALDGTLSLWKLHAVFRDVQAPATEDDLASEDEQQSAGAWPFRHIKSFYTGTVKKDDRQPSILSSKLVNSTAFLRAAIHPTKPFFAIVGSGAVVNMYSTAPGEEGSFVAQIDPSSKTKSEGSQTSNSNAKRKPKKDFGVSLEFDGIGQMVAVGTQQGFVHLFDVDEKTLRSTIAGHSMAVRALHFTADERLFVGCDDGKVSLYDVKVPLYAFDSQAIEEDIFADDFSQAQSSQHTSTTASSQGGKSIFSRTNSLTDRFKASSFVRDFDSNSMWLSCIKASPDGRILATCSIDGHVRIWDTSEPTSSPLCSLREPREVWSLAWNALSPDEEKQATMTSRAVTTAAAQCVLTASAFATANADGKIRWYRCAGTNA